MRTLLVTLLFPVFAVAAKPCNALLDSTTMEFVGQGQEPRVESFLTDADTIIERANAENAFHRLNHQRASDLMVAADIQKNIKSEIEGLFATEELVSMDETDGAMRAEGLREVSAGRKRLQKLISKRDSILRRLFLGNRNTVVIEIHGQNLHSYRYASQTKAMYENVSARLGWKVETLFEDSPSRGKVRSTVLRISGTEAQALLSNESGVHKFMDNIVLSETKKVTATVQVVVYPESKTQVEGVNKDDLLVERVRRSAGPGGQNVNKSETAIRITHVPTGLTVMMSNHRSQAVNLKFAMEAIEEKVRKFQAKQAREEHNSVLQEQTSSKIVRNYGIFRQTVKDFTMAQYKGGGGKVDLASFEEWFPQILRQNANHLSRTKLETIQVEQFLGLSP